MKLEIPHVADILELGSRIVTAVETCADRLGRILDSLGLGESRAPLCTHCRHPIMKDGRSSTGWTHFPDPPDPNKGWQGVRCPGLLTGATPDDDAA